MSHDVQVCKIMVNNARSEPAGGFEASGIPLHNTIQYK